ncbi:hypothetical protein CW304_07090 [Bacillus sp. UFRGS-B20]|nr:hypothetical protein CW304_07090 [Bacillus sp. UFRGS-B20]
MSEQHSACASVLPHQKYSQQPYRKLRLIRISIILSRVSCNFSLMQIVHLHCSSNPAVGVHK